MIMDVLASGIKDISPWCMLYADDIVLCGTRSEVVENKLEEWKRAMEDRGLKINYRKKTQLKSACINVGLLLRVYRRKQNLAERRWTASIRLIYICVCGSHTDIYYSKHVDVLGSGRLVTWLEQEQHLLNLFRSFRGHDLLCLLSLLWVLTMIVLPTE